MTDTPASPPSPPLPPTPPSPALPPSGPVDPKAAISGPSIALMVVGGLSIGYALLVIINMIFGLGLSAMAGNLGSLGSAVYGIRGFISILFNFVLGAVILYGAMQMKELKNYNLALVASIAAMLPCNCCCCIGLGVGIWSLVILMKPEVKAAFGQGGGAAL